MTLKIYQNNIRGFSSKCVALQNILDNGLKADFVLLNETNVRGNSKIKLKNSVSFTKNNPNKKSMGGISTSVAEWLKDTTVKVSEDSEGDEYLVTRTESVHPPLNIINVYGQQEGRDGREGKEKILESWRKIRKELSLIESRGEAALLIGDLNRSVGADELGIKGNKVKVSYGGQLLRDLMEEENYVLLNNLELATGGPWTREDPATGGKSALDLAIASPNLLPYVRAVMVDRERTFSAARVTVKAGMVSLTHPDLYPVILTLEMPTNKEKGEKQQSEPKKTRRVGQVQGGIR